MDAKINGFGGDMSVSVEIKPKLLLLDDEQEILSSLTRLFRKEFQIHSFTDGEEALLCLQEQQFSVIISDMRMPNMDGATFLEKAKHLQPNAKRLLLTGYADMESTIKAVNQGGIFNYISKPWNNQELKLQVGNALEQYNLVEKNRQLTQKLATASLALKQQNEELEQAVEQRTKALKSANQQLTGSVQKYRNMFLHVMEMLNLFVEKSLGQQKGHYQRVAIQSRLFAQSIGLNEPQCVQLYLAGLVHDLGQVTLPEELRQLSVAELNLSQLEQFMSHGVEGANILAKVPGLAGIADIVLHQFESYNGKGLPSRQGGQDISIEARILRIVKDHDNLLLGKGQQNGVSPQQAQDYLKSRAGELYDPKLLRQFLDFVEQMPAVSDMSTESIIMTNQAKPGMRLSKDLILPNGGLMLTAGVTLTPANLEKLRNYEIENDCFLTLFVS